MKTPSRRTPLAGAALALVLLLSGCVPWFMPSGGSTTSTPTDEEVPAELEPFYKQVLSWEQCGEMQCATASAPLDWDDPARDSIELALVRQPATGGEPVGSLLVNPGGPGGSGVDFIAENIDYATSERLQAEFDVVGFDPRGVNQSSAVSCYDDPAQMDAYLFDLAENERGTDAWIDEVTAASAQFSSDCYEHTGELLGYVDTISAARDLDLLRAVLGDETLNYLGFSYGTLLGAVYAELHPGKTGRLVLDGAVDPTVSSFDLSATQAQGFESALRAYLAECSSYENCPFRGSVDESMAEVRSILDSLDASPLRNEDGRQLGSGTMFTAIILPLYSQDNWPLLGDLFTSVMSGDPAFAFVLADYYYDRDESGQYTNNSTEAFNAINCLDYPTNNDRATMRAEAAELERLAPVFGHLMSYGGTGCAEWPFPPTAQREPIRAAGSADILVIGTTNDPATPYVWSENLAAQLDNGHLVTYEGEGHTAYNSSNACINDTVEEFLINGTVPAADPRC